MDEIEFKRAYDNLLVLIDSVANADARNTFKVMAHLISGLEERIVELQAQDDDDE